MCSQTSAAAQAPCSVSFQNQGEQVQKHQDCYLSSLSRARHQLARLIVLHRDNLSTEPLNQQHNRAEKLTWSVQEEAVKHHKVIHLDTQTEGQENFCW